MHAAQRSTSDRLATAIAGFTQRRPWLVIVAVLALAVGAASGARFLEFSNNYRVFFSPKNPEMLLFDEFQNVYSKNDNLLFVVKPPDDRVFTPQIAEAVEWLTAEAWKIPYAIRVDSLSNFQHSWADGDDLTVEDLIRDGGAMSAEALAAKQAIAIEEPLIYKQLLAEDLGATGVNVTLHYPEQSLQEVPDAMKHARGLAAHVEQQYPGVEVGITGISAMNNAFAESGTQDSMTLMPLMFLVLIVFMAITLRSLTGTLATLVVITLSTATALGLAGYLGIKLTPISATAPVIILTLAIADSVHVLITALNLMREGHSKKDAIRESMRINFLAVSITSVTTIVGFLTLNFSDAPPFWDLGNITAMGIASALVYSVFLLPAVLTVLPVRVKQRVAGTGFQERLGRIGDWVTARYRIILGTLGAAAILLVALVPTLELNDEWVKYFDYRTEFRNDAEFGLDELTGLYTIEFSLEAGEPEGVSNPAYLRALDRFTGWLRDQPETAHVYSYADIIKRLNKNMHGDDPTWYRLPEDRQLAAQYLLLYELSLPFGLDLNNRIALDKSATRVTATLFDMSTVDTRLFLERSRDWLATNLEPPYTAEPTGASVMFSYISQRNIESMLQGNVIAVLLISVIMIVALRSLSLGVLSLVPNALPILMALGIWAVLVQQVGMAAATVSASSLGIVVDDTVHFLTKYLRARREKGLDRPGAIRYAFEMVGTAILSTTIILSIGFGVLAASTFRINSQLGMLTSLVIIIALIVDFLLLPALLMIGHPRKQEAESHEPAVVPAS